MKRPRTPLEWQMMGERLLEAILQHLERAIEEVRIAESEIPAMKWCFLQAAVKNEAIDPEEYARQIQKEKEAKKK
ncbi:MAG: hypothetical protein J7L83_04325 [Thaumarchaeota archaeon]|nr:hypothetical protein [Nitrososphaerota archaeon]